MKLGVKKVKWRLYILLHYKADRLPDNIRAIDDASVDAHFKFGLSEPLERDFSSFQISSKEYKRLWDAARNLAAGVPELIKAREILDQLAPLLSDTQFTDPAHREAAESALAFWESSSERPETQAGS